MLVLISFGILIVFCVRWQIVEASKFIDISKNRVQSNEITSLRGEIYSSDGSTLAYSEPRFDVYIWLDDLAFFEEKKIQTREEFIKKVSPILGMTEASLSERISNYQNQGIRWIPIAKSIDKDQRKKLEDLKQDSNPTRALTGYVFDATSKRIYPEGRLASHVVGLVNQTDDKMAGVGGIEQQYDGILNPVGGFIIDEKDAIGQTVTASLLPTIEPKKGSSVVTTINKKLQQIVEEKIKKGVEDYQATSGTVIIADPKDGSILALANYPDYDPNTRAEKDPNAYGDSATLRPFEAGSIGKMLTIASAIDKGLITPDTIIQEEGHQGCEKIHNDLAPLCTWDKLPQAPMPAWECFAKSDNICFYHMAQLIDRRDFDGYLRKFGIGTSSGIDLGRGDSYGVLTDFPSWNIGDVSAYSYGHGYLINAIQAVDYMSAIANYGVRMKPRVVKEVIDADGVVQEYKPIVVERVITKETADTMAYMMNINFDRSIGPYEYYYHDLWNYDIGVKSGTALIADATGYSLDINSSFIGFDASPERTFVMLVKLERPQIPAYDRLAYYNVRPVWLDTFAAVKDVIGVPRK